MLRALLRGCDGAGQIVGLRNCRGLGMKKGGLELRLLMWLLRLQLVLE